MKNYKLIKTEKIKKGIYLFNSIILSCAFIFFSSGSLFSQENPWETTKPKGENPWATETIEEEKNSVIEQTTVVKPDTSITIVVVQPTEIPVQTPAKEIVNAAAQNSTSTVRQFNINGGIVKLNTGDRNFYRNLKMQGKIAHTANVGFGVGIATGSFFSIFALPVNLIGSVVPSYKSDRIKAEFTDKNPHATAEEKKAFNKGVNQKRVARAMGGNLIGIAINAAVILVLAFI